MNFEMLIFGLLPLVAFVVIDSFLGLTSGLIAAIVLALAEAIYTWVQFGSLDAITITSLLMVLVFGLWSLFSQKDIYMKLQPVFLGTVFGCIILVLQMMGKPILPLLFEKYSQMLPDTMAFQMNNPAMKLMLSKTSLYLGIGFLVHASLVAFCAVRLNNWWWLAMRGIGLYVMMAACVLGARFF